MEQLRQLRAVATRIDALTLKERVLLLAASVLALLMAWDSLLMQPLYRGKVRLQAEVATLQATLAETDALSADTIMQDEADPDVGLRAGLARAEAEMALVEADIRDRIGSMVPPERMAEVLESVLSHFDRLEFLALEGLGVEPVLKPVTTGPATAGDTATGGNATLPAPASEDSGGAYLHGLRIRFAGSYLDALAFLRALETLPWGFYWDRLELETRDYPRAEGSIVVYTLSLDRGWIGL
jgi:MSHA biogenesis protein MshJ